jgi:hypothetical protein
MARRARGPGGGQRSFRVHLDSPLLEAIRQQARQEDRSMGSVFRQSVRRYLEETRTPTEARSA